MTVQELIDELNQIEDKEQTITFEEVGLGVTSINTVRQGNGFISLLEE